jgi:hypothetical protein
MHIRGFSFRVDTGDAARICYKIPRYGPHEAAVIDKISDHMRNNDLNETNTGSWGSLVVLAAKANQQFVQWHEYVWRLCCAFRALNTITRAFTYNMRSDAMTPSTN